MHEQADLAIDTATRSRVMEAVLSKLRAQYVFPHVAQEMEEAIRGRLSNGEYDEIVTGSALRDRLTAHLQEVSHDKHLRVLFSVEPRPLYEGREPGAAERDEFRQLAAQRNFGFERIERLPGNIGYLDVRSFFPAEIGGAIAVAAMNVLANTSALIIDLRKNGGGSPTMIALLSSYLFDEPTHLNDLYWRDGDHIQQFWTLPYVPGTRYGDKPVYVLTSGYTFSGAEEFTYNLKNLKRATIIGETTGGGAHPGGGFPIDEHFAISIPTGRAINPISGTNWEGTGVTPDVVVPQAEALKVAHRAALEAVLARLEGQTGRPAGTLREEVRNALAVVDGEGADAPSPSTTAPSPPGSSLPAS